MDKTTILKGILYVIGIILIIIQIVRLVACGDDFEKTARIRFQTLGMIASIASLAIIFFIYNLCK